MKSDMYKWALGLAAPLMVAGVAGAHTIQPNASNEGPTSTKLTVGNTVETLWSYNADLTQTGELVQTAGTATQPRDGFVINAVTGFRGFDGLGSTTATFKNKGYDFSAVATTSAGLTSLAFTYTDAATVVGPMIPVVTISFYDTATTAVVGLGDWTSNDHATVGGAFEQSFLAVDLPNPNSNVPLTPLPTPAIAGTGLFGLLGIAALRRRNKAVAC